jgi:predicted membrane chloride channel (bestrophin family)
LRLPPWLDRVWLVAIAIAFAIGVPIWAILMSDRFGWPLVIIGIALALFVRYRPH